MADFHLSKGVDATANDRVYQVLKEYRDLRKKVSETQKSARIALSGIVKKKIGRLDRIIYLFKFRNQYFGRLDSGLRLYEMAYTPGFCKAITPHLEKLFELEYKIYKQFPEDYASVNWDKLDFTKAADVRSIIFLRYVYEEREERGENLREAGSRVEHYKWETERVIEQILEIVRRYEDKWAVPNAG